MAVFGKRGGSAAVLEAPEDIYAQSKWETQGPAPAGMKQRKRIEEEAGYSAPVEDKVYRPKRESLRYRLQMGVPKSVAGRILGSTALLMVVGGAVGAVWMVRSMLMHDPMFAIATSSEIQLEGNRHLTREQVLSVFGSDLDRNIFKVPLAERRADLERLPWVQHATVMRLLPNNLRVAVTERTPVAFVRDGNQIGLVDADGVLLDMPQDVAGDPKYSFPVLTGLTQADPLTVRAARMDVYRKFMTDLDSDPDSGAGKGVKPSQSISEVDVSNPEDVKALLASGGKDILVHFGDENFLKRYNLLEQNLPAWTAQYPKLASIDTRYENQMVLEMDKGTPVPMTAPAGAAPAATIAPAAVKTTAPAAAAAAAAAAKKPVVKAVVSDGDVARTLAVKTAAARPAAKGSMSKEQVAAMLAAARAKTVSQ